MNGKRTAVALLVMALGSVAVGAEAQPKATPKGAPVLGDKARTLYEEGRALAGKQKWAEAYASYFAAWSLLRHYQIASNLGNTEMKLGKYRDAAEHLWFAISEETKAGEDAAVVAGDRKLLDEALRHVGRIDVTVSVEGAEVLLGDTLLGTSPLETPLFVEPGTFTVHARKAGLAAAKVEMTIGKGEQKRADLVLGKEGGGPVPSASAAPPVPVPSASASAVVPGEAWPRSELIVGGAVLTGLALGGAVVTTVLANGKAGEREEALKALDTRTDPSPCSGASVPAACVDIKDNSRASDTFANIAMPLYVVGGVSALGTLAIVLLTDSPEAQQALRPQVGPGYGGFTVGGQF